MKGCCKTHHHKVKVEDNKSFVVKKSIEKPFEIESLAGNIEYWPVSEEIHSWIPTKDIPLSHSPPWVRTVPIFIQFRSILI